MLPGHRPAPEFRKFRTEPRRVLCDFRNSDSRRAAYAFEEA
jgi:hypothetical protein